MESQWHMSALCHLLFPARPGRPPPPPPPLCLFVCLADFLSFISCHPFPSEVSHLCSQDDSMTDLIARRSGWQNVCSIPASAAGPGRGSGALGSPQTYGAMSVPGRLQEGLRAGCLKCLRVGGATGTPLHFQACARRPAPVAAQTSQCELPVRPSG